MTLPSTDLGDDTADPCDHGTSISGWLFGLQRASRNSEVPFVMPSARAKARVAERLEMALVKQFEVHPWRFECCAGPSLCGVKDNGMKGTWCTTSAVYSMGKRKCSSLLPKRGIIMVEHQNTKQS